MNGIGQIECEHLGRMIFPSECTICSGAAKRLQDQLNQAPRVFEAKWPGHCNACNLPIVEGQQIAWISGEPVVHAECA